MSKDPVAGTLSTPESQNGFSYAHNDPINLSDPSGEAVPLVAVLVYGVFAGWAGYDTYQAAQRCDSGGVALGVLGMIPGAGAAGRIGSIISKGHAIKHLDEFAALGIKTQPQFAAHIDQVVKAPSAIRQLNNGRTAYWHEPTKTVVIKDPFSVDGGTAFKSSLSYFNSLR